MLAQPKTLKEAGLFIVSVSSARRQYYRAASKVEAEQRCRRAKLPVNYHIRVGPQLRLEGSHLVTPVTAVGMNEPRREMRQHRSDHRLSYGEGLDPIRVLLWHLHSGEG
ncbi:hypothetical protein JTB14_020507 [Gonioctena quinquepunctata]|nr:hypothetical protein JTB14_020507 [Gonioctena quinquepunctata]